MEDVFFQYMQGIKEIADWYGAIDPIKKHIFQYFAVRAFIVIYVSVLIIMLSTFVVRVMIIFHECIVEERALRLEEARLNDQSPVQKHPALCVSPSDVIYIRPDRRKFKKTIGDYQHV